MSVGQMVMCIAQTPLVCARGGSWHSWDPEQLRSANRGGDNPSITDSISGFRVVVFEAGGFPVLRGGSWVNDPEELRSALRFGFGSGSRFNISGFRIGMQS